MLITVLGPDGTGKTTLANKLAQDYNNLEYIYFGSNIESRKYKYFSSFLYSQKSGKWNTFLKYIFIFINDFYYFNLSKKKHLISDRCPIDKYVGSMVYMDKHRNLYHKLTLKLFPNPDLIILLEGDPEIIYSRKKEIPSDAILKYIRLYKKYIQSNRIKSLIIDTTKYGIEETYDLAYVKINALLNER
jgi:thymidylate kinase